MRRGAPGSRANADILATAIALSHKVLSVRSQGCGMPICYFVNIKSRTRYSLMVWVMGLYWLSEEEV